MPMGPRNPNRNAQFENIARLKKEYLKAGLPGSDPFLSAHAAIPVVVVSACLSR